jgi:protoporphyrinogen/coproporphyrinogen III oxidase
VRVAIVGGGISGLTAAHRLRQRLGPDAELVVIEQDRRLGGKLRTVELAGQPFDVGAEAFLSRKPEVTGLLAELGLEPGLAHPTPARAGIRAGGETRGIPPRTVLGVPASAEAVAGVLSADGVRRVAAETALPPVDLAGQDVAVGELLRARLGPEVADRLVDPLLGGVYAGRADGLGLRATMPDLAAALDAGAGALTTATTGLLPAPKPGVKPAPVFGTLTGGLAGLVGALAERSGAVLRHGLPVRALARTATGWRLAIGSAPAPEHLDADAVLLAVPAPAARKLLADVAPVASAGYAEVELASMAVIALALPAAAALPDSSGVLLASGERHADGTPFTAKAFTHSSRKWAHLDGGEFRLVRGSVGRHGEPEALQRDDDELVAAVRADLAELTGVTDAPVATVVTRWGGGLPQYGVGHLDLVSRIESAVAAVPGLAVAGSALHGVGLPACVATATAAAHHLADQLTAGPQR